MNLGNQPVEILVEDVYLLVVPSPQTSTDPEEDEARAQAAKAERLENAELLTYAVRRKANQVSGAFQSSAPPPFNFLDSNRVNTNARPCAIHHCQGNQ